MSRVLSCVIAEDERLFRDALTALLTSEWPKLQIVAACEDGGEALEALAENKPDVAFLDIRMPGLNGLDVAAACTELSPDTQVVFVTAYNQYAIDAFEKGAIDYLLKPVEPARLRATIARLQARVGSGERDTAALAALVKQLQQNLPARTAAEPLVWITACTGKDSRLILVDDVLYFQSDSKYTTVVTAEGEALLRTPLRELIARLDEKQFKQIHRATIVNLKAVAGISRDETGRGSMRLKGRPETLTVSLSYMPLFKAM
jgi:DNA-binding LytR/AlgR family response regulator